MKAKIITKNYVKSILRRYNKNNRIINDYRDYRNRNNISINKEEKEVKLVQFLLDKLTIEDRDIIEQRFVNNKTAIAISIERYVDERHVYRLQNKALNKMTEILEMINEYNSIFYEEETEKTAAE